MQAPDSRRKPAKHAGGPGLCGLRSGFAVAALAETSRFPAATIQSAAGTDAIKRSATGPSRAGVFNGSMKRRASRYSYVELRIFRRMIWKATGMRALLRRIDLSSAAVISTLVNFPFDALAASSCQAADNDLLVRGSGSM